MKTTNRNSLFTLALSWCHILLWIRGLPNGNAKEEDHSVIAWLKDQPGGFFQSSKMEYRHGGIYATDFISKGELLVVVPTNALFHGGTVGLEDGTGSSNNESTIDMDRYYQNSPPNCKTAWLLAQEYQKVKTTKTRSNTGDNAASHNKNSDTSRSSLFGPYVHFLMQEFDHEFLPLNWSPQAIELIQNVIVGKRLEPQDFGRFLEEEEYQKEEDKNRPPPVGLLYQQHCPQVLHRHRRKRMEEHKKSINNGNKEMVDGDENYELSEAFLKDLDAAFRIVIARGWGDVLVPVHDMFNHRNSGVGTNRTGCHNDWHNVDRALSPESSDRAEVDEEHRIIALRDIRPGEQLHNSYSQCHDVTCPLSLRNVYLTPQIFHDYGFVEQYPQRWSFEIPDEPFVDERPQVVFELDQINDNPNSLKLSWLRGTTRIPTGPRQRNVLFSHWQRLEQLYPIVKDRTEEMLAMLPSSASTSQHAQTQHEVKTIWEYYRALTTAFRYAVLAANHAASMDNSTNKKDKYSYYVEDNEEETKLESLLTSLRASLDDHCRASSQGMASDDSLSASCQASSKSMDNTINSLTQDDASPSTATPLVQGSRDTQAVDKEDTSMSASQLRTEESADGLERQSSLFERSYDPLDDRQDTLDYQFLMTDTNCNWEGYDWAPTKTSDYSSSRMSRMQFDHHYNPELHKWNSCLQINEWLQSCTSFRPHYHEIVVHYPALYVQDLRRVLFLGGGDIMILHEILKYPNLELVLGMELDPQVLRSSFRNTGIQPKFEHPAVHWAFGDATKSLLMIPKSWYGTFDLVVVDLQNFVFDTILVTPEMTIMDFVAQMVSPNGVIARNDDFVRRRGNMKYAKYVVEVELHDVPRLCKQSLTMASNGIDFLQTTVPTKNSTKTDDFLFFDPVNRHTSKSWTNYRNHHSEVDLHEPVTQSSEQSSVRTTEQSSPNGILFTLEVENATVPLGISTLVQAKIRHALLNLRISLEMTEDSWGPLVRVNRFRKQSGDSALVIVLPEAGYVTARLFPKHNYCAYDILLWNHFEDQYKTLHTLVEAVGGQWAKNSISTSFYSSVAIAPYGIKAIEDKLSTTGENPNPASPPTANLLEEDWQSNVLVEMTERLGRPRSRVTDLSVWVVMCGKTTEPCHSFEALRIAAEESGRPTHVVPLWACTDLSPAEKPEFERNNSSKREELDLEIMATCELHTRKFLTAATTIEVNTNNVIVEENPSDHNTRHPKITAVVIDEETPRGMGQVLHKILNNTRTRHQLCGTEFVIIERITDSSSTESTDNDSSTSSWASVLLERVRTEMIQFNPVFHTEALFTPDGSVDMESRMTLGILSSGNKEFYGDLSTALSHIRRNSSLTTEVLDSKAGVARYLPDFTLSTEVTTSDFDTTDAKVQWNSQLPIGHQSLYQFEIQMPLPPLAVNDYVLCNDIEHVWYGLWYNGKVTAVNTDGTYSVVYGMNRKRVLPRRMIRKLQLDPTTEYKFADRILLHKQNFGVHDDVWFQASVTEKIKDGESRQDGDDVKYKVQILSDEHGEQIASPSDMIYQMEQPDANAHSEITLDKLDTLMRETIIPSAFAARNDAYGVNAKLRRLEHLIENGNISDTLDKLDSNDDMDHGTDDGHLHHLLKNYHVTKVGDGYILSYLWSPVESLIVVWDGRTRLDVNLFSTHGKPEDDFRKRLERSFLETFDFLTTTMLHEQPRGIGRIVNTDQEKESFWFGQLEEYRDFVLKETEKNNGIVPHVASLKFPFGRSLEVEGARQKTVKQQRASAFMERL